MAKFRVNIMETSYGSVVVEANSSEEAMAKAEEKHHEGNVHWTSSEFVSQEVEEEN